MTAEIVLFPRSEQDKFKPASAVARRISEIMTLISTVAQDLETYNLPEPLRAQLIVQLQRLAIQACSINLTVAEHLAVPADFSDQINAIIAKLKAAKPSGPG